ncbi:hypothetical protein [Conyzicola sp.]|uniref:hypothetical protein n=1 Tax=Conyzicola sp. TaxID=1969404 RepID=UPI003989FB99
MIGYYAHHRGAGHLHRAMSIAHELGDEVTILSSSPRPAAWTGGWVDLPLDHSPHDRDADADATAHDALHWAPLGSDGLRERMGLIAEWLRRETPSAVVVDVSVEVALLVRLHGIPVISIAQPGDRADAPHSLGYRASSAIVAVWPPDIAALTVADDVAPRIEPVGAISRIATVDSLPRVAGQIAVLAGLGTRGVSALDAAVAEARRALPDADWVVLSGADSATVAHTLRTSALVIAHCGENALAEIAASRVPAIILPEDRPHDEQHAMGRALAASDMPVAIVDPTVDASPVDWARLVRETAALDGEAWSVWCDGGAAARAAAIVRRVARPVGAGDAGDADDAPASPPPDTAPSPARDAGTAPSPALDPGTPPSPALPRTDAA